MDTLSHLVIKRHRVASMKAFMGTLRNEAIVRVTCQIPSSQGLGASNFHIWHQNLGRQPGKLSLEGFGEGHEDAYDVSSQSAFFHNLSCFAGQIWRTSHRITRSQAHY
jgi:hypothetical protein